jgi:hypothetical protein
VLVDADLASEVGRTLNEPLNDRCYERENTHILRPLRTAYVASATPTFLRVRGAHHTMLVSVDLWTAGCVSLNSSLQFAYVVCTGSDVRRHLLLYLLPLNFLEFPWNDFFFLYYFSDLILLYSEFFFLIISSIIFLIFLASVLSSP